MAESAGGKRPGAGRPKGRRSQKTLERMAVNEAFNQRIMAHADSLFHAQFALSVGSVKVFRVDEDDNGKRTHELVTSPDEIKKVLDAHEGEAGIVGEHYYFVTAVSPDNRALDSMLNRGLGKPVQEVKVQDDRPDITAIAQEVVDRLISEKGWKEEKARQEVGKIYGLQPEILTSDAVN